MKAVFAIGSVILSSQLGIGSAQTNDCQYDHYTGCPSDCAQLTRNRGNGRKYCSRMEDPYCKRRGRHGGCIECDNGYFKRDFSSACVSCSEVFGDTCNSCDDYYGCTSCADGYTLMVDDDCGLNSVNFGYCAPNDCDDNDDTTFDTTSDDNNNTVYTYTDNTIENTPVFLYGYSAVGPREGVVTAEELDTADDMGVSHRDARRMPLPCPQVWSIFDNYVEFQQLIPTHRNDTHFSGPHNEVGEIVIFLGTTYAYVYYEELTIKDDVNYVWQIDGNPLPETGPNPFFDIYWLTLTLYNDTYVDFNTKTTHTGESCLLLADIETDISNWVPTSLRSSIYEATRERLQFYTEWIFDVIMDKVGTETEGTIYNISVPQQWLYDYLTNWENTEYILLADQGTVKMLNPDIRNFSFASGTSYRITRLAEKDDEQYTLTSELLNPRVAGYLTLREFFTVKYVDENTCDLHVKVQFYPQYEEDRESLLEYWENVKPVVKDVWPDLFYELYSADTPTTTNV